ncbi:cytochrome P450 81Q32-like [Silene latifolia]|uniref:cytochrome P450 81Q32-like n=1 Tax=Silene latifolia TaxID=37657 RepID=UPI003D77B8D0
MEQLRWVDVIALTFLGLLWYFISSKQTNKQHQPPPPSPPSPSSLPIIGHLHLLNTNQPVHRSLHELSSKYGPIYSLKLGRVMVVVISSPSLVKECFIKNDAILANRPYNRTSVHFHYNGTTLAAAPYGSYWRELRRITNLEFFSATRLNLFTHAREEEIKSLIKDFTLEKENLHASFVKVEIKSELFQCFFNIIMRMLIGKIYAGKELDEILKEIFELSGAVQDPNQYSDQTIRGIILIMLLGGIDTAIITMEWTLALLLNNQNVLHKAQLEIDSCIGRERLVDESDLDNLKFIQNIINETLRLFPPGPLLLHESSEDCNIAGYQVRKGTMVLVNTWAVHRDRNVWDDPLAFTPERFEGFTVNEYRSSFIPFGLGRRSCPGTSLANRTMTLLLTALIQCFDWETNGGMNVDLIEGSGLMPMATPLVAMCIIRYGMSHLISNL